MSSTRLALRQAIGTALGRNYYASGVTAAGTTVDHIADPDRTEYDAFWDGASCRIVGLGDRIIRGGAGASTGRTPTINFNRALASVPSNGTAYELLKGWTIADLDTAISAALSEGWPYLFDSIDDNVTFLTIVNQTVYPLTDTWMRVAALRMQVPGTSPTEYRQLRLDDDYFIRETATGLTLELGAFPQSAGLKLWFTGEAIATLGPTDAAVTRSPADPIIHGAKWWLYDKGAQPDEASSGAQWGAEAKEELGLYQASLRSHSMPRRDRRRMGIPRIEVINDGNTVPSGY